MSLKSFHVFFIVLSILVTAGCAVWAFVNGVSGGFGPGCAVASVALLIYGMAFLKKAKRIIT
jgi:hypothetical protein